MTMIRKAAVFFAFLTLAVLLGSYGGRLHPLGDSLAVFRPVFALLLLALSFALTGAGRYVLLAVALLALLPILWLARPVAVADPTITVYQKNLLFRRGDPSDLIADFRASGADVILLEELSDANLQIPQALIDSHPHQLICSAHTVGAVAILSVHPLSDPYCREGSGYAIARVQHPAGAFTAVAIHLHWPYPFGQEAQVNQIMADIAGASRPMILGGDFNMVPWAGAPRRIADVTDTRIAAPIRPTLFVKGYPLPIDHVLTDARMTASVERRAQFGSDHYGVLARIGRTAR